MPFVELGKSNTNQQPQTAQQGSGDPAQVTQTSGTNATAKAQSGPVQSVQQPQDTSTPPAGQDKPEETKTTEQKSADATIPVAKVGVPKGETSEVTRPDGVREVSGPPLEAETKVESATTAQPSQPEKKKETAYPTLQQQEPEEKKETKTEPAQTAAPQPNTQTMVAPASAPAPAQTVEQKPAQVAPTTPAPVKQEVGTISPVAKPPPATKEETNVQVKTLGVHAKDIKDYMKLALERDASDIHVSVGYPVYLRVDGSLEKVGVEAVKTENVEALLKPMITPSIKKMYEEEYEVDFMYHDKENDVRFRVNMFHEKGNMTAALRLIPSKIKSIEDLKLPPILREFSKIPYGLILVTGPTGSGKSTTIAAMLEEINRSDPRHIISIEDPVEYVYEPKVALIAQRSMKHDTLSWNNALRAVLRQDPDVVLIGEMRDYETIAAAITTAETGHLVFATLHTNSAAQSIDRIIDVFPEGQQNQVRAQLASVISGVVAQRLVPIRGGGRKAVIEILIGIMAIKNTIREGKTHQIDNIIQTNSEIGMQTLESSLVKLVKSGEIDIETAKNFTSKPDEIDLLMK